MDRENRHCAFSGTRDPGMGYTPALQMFPEATQILQIQ